MNIYIKTLILSVLLIIGSSSIAEELHKYSASIEVNEVQLIIDALNFIQSSDHAVDAEIKSEDGKTILFSGQVSKGNLESVLKFLKATPENAGFSLALSEAVSEKGSRGGRRWRGGRVRSR